MKCVDATWEQRNFGRNAFEISLNKTDLKRMQDVQTELRDKKYEGAYVTVRLPVGDLACVHLLEDIGFRFMETQIAVSYDLRNYRTPKAYDLDPVSVVEVPHDECKWREVVDKITPKLFETDRISLDPILGPEIGCRRYKNWIMDLIDKPEAHLMLFESPDKQGEPYGFSIDRLNAASGEIHVILAGVFADCEKLGVGMSIWDALFKNAVARGATILRSAVSSNNPTVIVLDSVLGVQFCKLTYVFRKQF